MIRLVIIILFISTAIHSKKDESSLINFDAIKGVIKNDMLGHEVEKKTKGIKAKKYIQNKRKIGKYNIPTERDYWEFVSEYWLVKNATLLKWDFEKPDYGLNRAFSDFLKRMGVYEKNFKILFLNSPQISHMALPANSNKLIFLLSVPFMRVLDLSKLEICLILFEDYLRIEKKMFKKFALTDALKSQLGNNFAGKNLKFDVFKETFKRYDQLVFEKGFSFQQQFEITRYFGKILKSDLKLWNTYVALLKKIDNLVKSNILYKDYVKIYPSPELQISWLVPSQKVLD